MKHRYVEAVDLEALPQGEVSRLFVELAEDGLGRPIHVPVLVARGSRPGPVFGITAAVHGNELNGIPVIHRLFQRLDPTVLRGSVVAAVVVNVPGYLRYTRRFNDDEDLNHIFPGREDGNCSEVFVHRLLHRIVRHFDYLIDLHTASFGRVNSLYVRADMTVTESARMAYLQRPQIIVHNPPRDQTLRGTAQELGIPSITVEIGNPQRFSGEFVKRCRTGLRAVLGDLGMLPRRRVGFPELPVVCAHSYWQYTDRGGMLDVLPGVTDPVARGERIARLTDAFGDLTSEYFAPEAGVVVGRSVNPVAQSGSRILHLGVLATSEDNLLARAEE